jgi:hypothetical protein
MQSFAHMRVHVIYMWVHMVYMRIHTVYIWIHMFNMLVHVIYMWVHEIYNVIVKYFFYYIIYFKIRKNYIYTSSWKSAYTICRCFPHVWRNLHLKTLHTTLSSLLRIYRGPQPNLSSIFFASSLWLIWFFCSKWDVILSFFLVSMGQIRSDQIYYHYIIIFYSIWIK